MGVQTAFDIAVKFSQRPVSFIRKLRKFPGQASELKLKKHHGRAEGLLLAEYLRRKLSVNAA